MTLTRTKTFRKKFARLAARAVFVRLVFLQKQLIYDFLAGNNYPDSPHLQDVMKFAHKFHLYLIVIKNLVMRLTKCMRSGTEGEFLVKKSYELGGS